jgi:regulator of sigma E protease
MNTLIGIFLVLGVMVLVHEWGHFVVARLFDVRVDVFSIGFGPRLFGFKRGTTDYRISAIPLGGYVRMAGQDMSDVDAGTAAPTGAPDELMSKPRWQRALISAAGPAVNLVMPILLLAGFYVIKGLPYPAYLNKPMVITSLPKTSPLAKAGVIDGDTVVAIDNVPTPSWAKVDQFLSQVAPDSTLHFSVDHAGTQQIVDVKAADLKNSDALGTVFVPPVVGQVTWMKPAKRAGMKRGDLILSVNETPVKTWQQYVEIIRHGSGQDLHTVVQRDGKQVELVVHPAPDKDELGKPIWVIGVGPEGQWEFREMTFTASVKEATLQTVDATGKLLTIVGRLITGKLSVRQLQSFVGIAVQAGQAVQEGPVDTITLMAMISLNLGILNLLPIPILDGGNILLLALEGIRRRDFSLAFKERFVQVGLVFLLVLFAFVMYNDVARLLPTHTQ